MRKNLEIVDIATEYGGAAASTAVGAAIGAAAAGPVGVVGGAIAGKVVERLFQFVGDELKERQLSKSESKKMGAVAVAVQDKIRSNLDAGKSLRSDDFFTVDSDGRTFAEEVVEGVLFAAQRENEEKKLPYLANLYANIAFDATISRAMSNQLVRVATEMTYRQVVILSVIGKYQTGILRVPSRRTTAFNSISGYDNISIASEIFDLYRKSLVFSKDAVLDAAGITPSLLEVCGIGALLYNNMELSTLDDKAQVDEIIRFLSM